MYEYILGNDLADADDGRKEEEARLPRPSDTDDAIRAPHQGELFSRCVLCAGAEVRNGLGGSGIPYLASQRSLLSESVVTRQRPRRKRSAVRRTDKEGIGLYLMYWIGWHGRIMPRARALLSLHKHVPREGGHRRCRTMRGRAFIKYSARPSHREMPFVRQRDDGIHVSPETREVM